MIVILGAGITGLSIAYHLREMGVDFIIIEKEKEVGGLCRSIKSGNYTFDYTGHFLHAKTNYIKALAEKLVPGIPKIKRNSFIYLKGKLIPYPFQANLNYLPLIDRIKSIKGFFIKMRKVPVNLEEWILSNFGEGMAELFFFPYNRKLWKYPLSEITPDFIASFVPEVSLFRSRRDIGYNVEFLYPRKGIGEFTTALAKELQITHGEVIKVDDKYVLYTKGAIRYEHLVSTIPLPEFLSKIDLKEDIPLSKDFLRWNSVFCLNIGIKGNLFLPDYSGRDDFSSPAKNHMGSHWIYFPEEHFPFYRVGSFTNISPMMAPEGHSSLWVETSYRGKRPENKIIDKTIEILSNLGFFDRDSVDHILPLDIPYAYPIYNKERKEILYYLENYLEKCNITLAGRFGGWKYSYMEESILEGKRIAEELCRG